jgi:transglutaminase-like putative cysteine protease
VYATSFYSDGEWSSALRGDLGPNGPVPLPPDRNRREYVMTVTNNRLKAPRLAAPHPVVSTNISPSNSRIDPVTREVQVERAESSYEVTYAVPAPIPAVLRNAGPPSSPDILQEDLRLPERESQLILRWSEEVTSGESTDYDKAVAIQAHLRDTTRYTYNLDLGPALRDENGRELDPLAQFYESRRGYCVQFASAMIMLSRAQGIPARMAIGFLPGSPEDSAYVVRQSNAHAWPELYFEGAGWVRFEPTAHQSGAPAYSLPSGAEPGATTTAPTGSTNSASAPTSRRGFEAGEDVSAPTETSWVDELLTGGNLVLLLTLLVVAVGTFLMPVTAWVSRSLRRRRAATRQDLVEIEWEALRSHLGDLGLSAPPGATLRAARERYITDGHLDTEHATAMRRVTTTLERARYDRPERTTPQQTEELHRDIRSIRRQVSTTRSWTTRLRSFLWPTEGVSVWRGLVGRVRHRARRTKGT